MMKRHDEIPLFSSATGGLALAGLVHDLNNVFQTLIGVAVQLDGNRESALLSAAILRSVERGQNILAGLEQGTTELVPLETILAHAVSFLDDHCAATGAPTIAVKQAIDPDIELGGHWAWERVFINLFLNSARAMPRGGTIRVEALHRENGIEMTVIDNGTGIPQNVLGHLFEPHVSANGSTGLGLCIVQSIVERSGGRVRASNRRDGHGAQFTISLPVRSSSVNTKGVALAVAAGK